MVWQRRGRTAISPRKELVKLLESGKLTIFLSAGYPNGLVMKTWIGNENLNRSYFKDHADLTFPPTRIVLRQSGWNWALLPVSQTWLYFARCQAAFQKEAWAVLAMSFRFARTAERHPISLLSGLLKDLQLVPESLRQVPVARLNHLSGSSQWGCRECQSMNQVAPSHDRLMIFSCHPRILWGLP